MNSDCSALELRRDYTRGGAGIEVAINITVTFGSGPTTPHNTNAAAFLINVTVNR